MNAPVNDVAQLDGDASTSRARARAHRRLTASGLERAEQCPASFALAAVEDRETDAMRAGTGRHAYLDAVAAHLPSDAARELALDTVPADAPWREQCEAIDLAELLTVTGADTGRVETGLSHAWDPVADTAVALDVATHRAYPDSAGIPGTLDWLVTSPNGRVRVVDFKGSQPTTRAADNSQLALYALQVARARGLAEVDVQLVYLGEDGSVRTDDATLDAWDLDAAAARLRGIWQRVQDARAVVEVGGAPRMRVGDHCGECPAMRVCPAMVSLVRELTVSAPRTAAPEAEVEAWKAGAASSLAQLSDEAAGEAWLRVELLGDLVAAMRASLKARAERVGLPLPGGAMLVPVESRRRTVEVALALPVLRARFGAQADAAVEQSLSIAAVEKLARQLAPGRGQRKAVEALVEELRAARAVRETTFVQLRVRKAKASAEADDAA